MARPPDSVFSQGGEVTKENMANYTKNSTQLKKVERKQSKKQKKMANKVYKKSSY